MERSRLYMLLLIGLMGNTTYAQLTGIGSNQPNVASLLVAGTANYNSSTIALFGNNPGISIQQNWSTIGFNQYRDVPYGYGKSIGSGYGMHLTMSYPNGNLELLDNGFAIANTALPLQIPVFRYLHRNAQEKIFLNSIQPGGILKVADQLFVGTNYKVGPDDDFKLNMVPLGIISLSMNYGTGISFSTSAINVAGNLMVSSANSISNGIPKLSLTLNASRLAGYASLVILTTVNIAQSTQQAFQEMHNTYSLGTTNLIEITAKPGAAGNFHISSTLIVYGIAL